MDPDRNFFVIPNLEHPVTWYGFLLAFGFLVGYFLVRRLLRCSFRIKFFIKELKTETTRLADRLTFSGDRRNNYWSSFRTFFFYDWSYYSRHPEDIFKVWEGDSQVIGALWEFYSLLGIYNLESTKSL